MAIGIVAGFGVHIMGALGGLVDLEVHSVALLRASSGTHKVCEDITRLWAVIDRGALTMFLAAGAAPVRRMMGLEAS
jgi:hypothetical protein